MHNRAPRPLPPLILDGTHMRATALAILASTTCLIACVPYPIYKTLQPAAKATVLNQKNEPVTKAEVILISSAYPYGFEKNRMTKETGVDGTATFESEHEWRTEVLMIHGSEIFFWNWCIRKEGYATYNTTNRDSEFQDNVVIQLNPGFSTPCPQPFRLNGKVKSDAQQ
jgi:hypothetical protein